MDSDNELDIDTSWIDEQEKLQNINTNYYREPMNSMNIFFLYINQNNYIENIICEKHQLIISESQLDSSNKNSSFLSKEFVLKLIQTKKKKTPVSKYKFKEILLFNVDLDTEHIQSFSMNDNYTDSSHPFFKKIPIIDDIFISDSIFIFHSLNSLFFIFQEYPNIISNTQQKHTLKSILKPSINNIKNNDKFHTKKNVRILLDKNKTYKVKHFI
jgi:hypothetical protein